jgi:hypothetical protein
VIRFSAGLVVVALGVLIGGVVTSKLSLVYVSIAVSVLALIVWAIGIFLKREELFGGRPELVPAGAGVGAGSPAPERPAPVPQSPAPSPVTPVTSAAADRLAYGQDGYHITAFSPPAQVRSTWTGGEKAENAQAGRWGATSAPPSATPPVDAGSSDAGSSDAGSSDIGSSGALRSWFDRPATGAKPPAATAAEPVAVTAAGPVARTAALPVATTTAEPVATTGAMPAHEAPAAKPGDTGPSDDAIVPADDDEDWPTRYSWLDDEQADEAVESDDVPLVSDDAVAAEVEASDLPKPPPDAADEAPVLPSVTDGGATPGSGTKMVTVVPGVPRYHEPDCILIRFMPEKDVQTKSIPEAKAAKCTPCVACQPED